MLAYLRTALPLILLSLLFSGCQTMLNFSAKPQQTLTHDLEQSPSAVGLPSCSGVLITPSLVLTKENCLAATEKRAYVVLGQNQALRKLLRIAEVQTIGQGFGLVLLAEPAPQPFQAVVLNHELLKLVAGRNLWVSSYAPEGDMQSFGQISHKNISLKQANEKQIFGEGECLPEGSPLMARHNAEWVLIGLASSPETCRQKASGSLFDRVELSMEDSFWSEQGTGGSSPKHRESFQLLQEIELEEAPYQAKVAFPGGNRTKNCEYSLRVVRHNSFFETRYDLRSQPVNPRADTEASLIFEDIYAALSPYLGKVKRVGLGSATCQSADA